MESGKFAKIVKWEEKSAAERIRSQAIERNKRGKNNCEMKRS
jgi:hypothetical protein